MAAVGNSWNYAELRKKPRRSFHYNARILTKDRGSLHRCSIADISETGARIVLESECELPQRVMLLLTRKGDARRKCRVVWRNGLTVGLEFSGAV